MMSMIVMPFLFGCMQVEFDLTAHEVGIPVSMNSNAGRPYNVIAHFKTGQQEKGIFIQRLYGGAQPDLNAMVQRQLAKTDGDAIVNVKIKGEAQFGDVLLPVIFGIGGTFVHPLFSFFIFEPFFTDLKTYTVEGDIVRFTDTEQKRNPFVRLDPATGLPVQSKPRVEFDPETGLPKRE